MSSTINDAADTFLSHPGSPPTPALLDTIRDSAAAGDATGDLVPSHDLMLDEGLFHILVPRELGGAGGTATDWFDAGLAIAGADPSAGWIMLQGAAQLAWMAVSADPSFAADVLLSAADDRDQQRRPVDRRAQRGRVPRAQRPLGLRVRQPGRFLPRGHGADHRVPTEPPRRAWCSCPRPRRRSSGAGTPTGCAAPAATTSTSATS